MMQYEDFNKPEQVTRLYWMEELMPRVASDYAPGGIEPIKTVLFVAIVEMPQWS